jgi:hypothetical protein
MGRCFKHAVKIGLVLLMVAHSAACHGGSGRRGRSLSETREEKALATQPVVSPLTVNVTHGALLKGINSLEIATPVLPGNAARSLSHEEVRAMVTRTARETMTLKIFDSVDRRGADGAKVDGVLRTEIIQFHERQGSEIGGEPATVSFRMSIVSAIDKRTVWDAHYFYRQEPLSDNLLKLGERLGSSGTGAGWVSGHSILQRGVIAAIEDFNRRREQQFLVTMR